MILGFDTRLFSKTNTKNHENYTTINHSRDRSNDRRHHRHYDSLHIIITNYLVMVSATHIELIGELISSSGFSEWVLKRMDDPCSAYNKVCIGFCRHLNYSSKKLNKSNTKLGIMLHYVYAIRYGENGAIFRLNTDLGDLVNEMYNCAREVAWQLGDKSIPFYKNN